MTNGRQVLDCSHGVAFFSIDRDPPAFVSLARSALLTVLERRKEALAHEHVPAPYLADETAAPCVCGAPRLYLLKSRASYLYVACPALAAEMAAHHYKIVRRISSQEGRGGYRI